MGRKMISMTMSARKIEQLKRKKVEYYDLSTPEGVQRFSELTSKHPALSSKEEAEKFLRRIGMLDESGEVKEALH